MNTYYSKRIINYTSNIHGITYAKINTFAQYLPDNLSPVGYSIDDVNIKNMVKVIVDTRRKEFVHEGNRWYDVKRFNIQVTHTSYDRKRTETLVKDDLRRQFQIPESAISFGITPNPR
ncbi:hypothetical protein FACS1894180_9210 [Bacteroidia bacterium]|nr:hypothetical protein FACS1894180_9210 [Bacteroidia bacterium]